MNCNFSDLSDEERAIISMPNYTMNNDANRVYSVTPAGHIIRRDWVDSVQVHNSSSNELPKYATTGSSGKDVYANVSEPVFIHPGERVLIDTGLTVAIPEGYEIQVRPRSGLALKHGITVLNTPGTIDADYRGKIGIILFNTSNTTFRVNNGDRIAQIVMCKVEKFEWREVITVEDLSNTGRGEGGFGHTLV